MKTTRIRHIAILILIFTSITTQQIKAESKGDTTKYFNITKISDEQIYMYLPEFTYEKDDISRDLSELKGKLILINLWATWCGPCKKEIPDLMKLYEEYKDDNFEILGIMIADKKDNLEKFLDNNHINYTIINGNERFISAITVAVGTQINAIPYTIIADESGRIVETITGTKTYEEFKKIINKYKNR